MITSKEARIATNTAESIRKELLIIESKIKQRAYLGYSDVVYECEIIPPSSAKEVANRLREFGFKVYSQPHHLLKLVICWRDEV